MQKHDYLSEAAAAAATLGLDFTKVPFTLRDLAAGIKVEYEHGRINMLTNVTDDDALDTAKIALAHLLEKRNGIHQYDYYDALDVMEDSPPGYWRGKGHGVFFREQFTFRLIFAILLIIVLICAVVAAKTWWFSGNPGENEQNPTSPILTN